MKTTLGMLVLMLVGTSLAMTGVLLMLSRRPSAKTLLVAPLLMLLGITLGTGAWWLGQGQQRLAVTDINQLLQQAPPAAGRGQEDRFRDIAILLDSTPSDSDKAQPDERQAYAGELAGYLATSVQDADISLHAEGQAMPIDDGPKGAASLLCDGHDLLVLIRMPAVRLPGQDAYALWREPEVELHWCDTGQSETYRFQVLERHGDAVPYEQALRTRLLELLRNVRHRALRPS